MQANLVPIGIRVIKYSRRNDGSKHPAWNKLLAVKDTMLRSQENDWIVWIDADCIVNRGFDIADDLEDKAQFDFLSSQDWNGLCTGVFAVKHCAWSIWFLDTLYRCGDVRNDDDYGKACGCKWEQNGIKALEHEFPSVAEHISYLDSAWVDHYPWLDVNNISPVHHYGGIPNSKRLVYFRKYPYGLARK
jgi:hypothetical protein